MRTFFQYFIIGLLGMVIYLFGHSRGYESGHFSGVFDTATGKTNVITECMKKEYCKKHLAKGK